MRWLVPFSGREVAHLMRVDGAWERLVCNGHYANAAIGREVSGAPRCLRCLKVAGALDRKMALQETWN